MTELLHLMTVFAQQTGKEGDANGFMGFWLLQILLILGFFILLSWKSQKRPKKNPDISHADFLSYAGFWRRLAAFLIDVFIFFILFPVLGLSLFAIEAISGIAIDNAIENLRALQGGIIHLLPALIIWFYFWLYFAIMESSSTQGTLGKMALGIKVTDLEGNKIGFRKAIGRNLGKIISGGILGIGYLMAGFTGKKQALHDMMAECLVVKKQSASSESHD